MFNQMIILNHPDGKIEYLMKKFLLKDLTVFIISTDEETTDLATESLINQNCEFKIDYIQNIFPMYKAFQTMPSICKTKYFIQVDADMILEPFAIEYLYKQIIKSPFWIYRVSCALNEEGFGVGGAIKCWKKSIFKYFQFKDVRTVDRDFHKRVKKFGLNIRHYKKIIGIHRPRHSKFSNYLKTKSDIEKWKFLRRDFNIYAKKLLFKILLFEEEDDPLKFLGFIFGVMTEYLKLIRSKNIYDEKIFYEKYFNKLNINSFYVTDSEKSIFQNLIENLYSDFYCENLIYKKKLFNLTMNKFKFNLDFNNYI